MDYLNYGQHRNFLKDNHIIIKNFINEKDAKILGENVVNYSFKEELNSATNATGIHNPIWGLEILTHKCYNLSKIIGDYLLPTYCYARVYKNNSELYIHKDRPSCEVSLTLHLDGDSSWPIWIQTPEGDNVSVDLQSGDAMVYLGCLAPHWREKYTGNQYSQLFLHYVRSRGKNSQHYFDIPKVLQMNFNKKCQ